MQNPHFDAILHVSLLSPIDLSFLAGVTPQPEGTKISSLTTVYLFEFKWKEMQTELEAQREKCRTEVSESLTLLADVLSGLNEPGDPDPIPIPLDLKSNLEAT